MVEVGIESRKDFDVVVVGAGFSGLSAAFELAKNGKRVCVLEAETVLGGLASTFEFSDGVRLEKFYHHWFDSDVHVRSLVHELGLDGEVILSESKTGMFLNGRIWKLSSPLDLIRFRALSIPDRFRLAALLLHVRRVIDWKKIEHLSIREWLEPICGKTVYRKIWEPLITAKFSVFSEQVSAVWMWKKLALRGGTRSQTGHERLAYFRGGFGRLAEKMAGAVTDRGGVVTLSCRVTGISSHQGRIKSLVTSRGEFSGLNYIFTTPLPTVAEIAEGQADSAWISRLRRVKFLGNICLVLRLRNSLSETYWVNVNDPGFPFVGVIEHTNLDSSDNYAGSKIAYLSRYLAHEDPIWGKSDDEYFEYAFSYLLKMFPNLAKRDVLEYRVWRSPYAQPIAEKNYSTYIPPVTTPFDNGFLCTMAQIYPEDRGTNYAIRDGISVARLILAR